MNEHLKGHKSLAEMVSTHIYAYRTLLENARDGAAAPSHETDDASYYQHELFALDDIEAACAIEMGVAPPSKSGLEP